jgi:hypothetical protein
MKWDIRNAGTKLAKIELEMPADEAEELLKEIGKIPVGSPVQVMRDLKLMLSLAVQRHNERKR